MFKHAFHLVRYCKYTGKRIGIVDGPFERMHEGIASAVAYGTPAGYVDRIELDAGLCPSELALELDSQEIGNPRLSLETDSPDGCDPYNYTGRMFAI